MLILTFFWLDSSLCFSLVSLQWLDHGGANSYDMSALRRYQPSSTYRFIRSRQWPQHAPWLQLWSQQQGEKVLCSTQSLPHWVHSFLVFVSICDIWEDEEVFLTRAHRILERTSTLLIQVLKREEELDDLKKQVRVLWGSTCCLVFLSIIVRPNPLPMDSNN